MTFATFRDRLLPISLSQGVGLACGILSVRFTTHWISPEELGRYGVFITLASLGMWVFHAGVARGVNRLWAASPDRRGLLREARQALGGKRAVWFCLATLALCALAEPQRWPVHWPALVLAALGLSVLSILQGALQATRSHWADLSVSTFASSFRSLLPPILFLLSGGSALAMRAGFLSHAVVASLVAAFWIQRQLGPPAPAAKPSQRQLDESWLGRWFLVLSLAAWALNGLNRWVAAGFFPPAFAGHFTLASNISMIPTSMFGVIVVQFFQPGLYSLSHDTAAGRRAIARRTDLIALGYTATALGGLAVVRWLVPSCVGVLIDERYLPSLPLIFASGCFITAILLLNLFQLQLLAARREGECGPVEITSASFLVGGCVAGAWLGGESGFLASLYLAPLVPWLLTRPLMRRRLALVDQP
ncbi:lipopolysaccharide biosynthesis protein [Nibricoccus sp. IMCC34717]|uniref:lipopolysaccharide biosynthesis protein n=1 Tax=Nibricoccus sp. IMCC34717 TaxID=3034021 RepID=UPI00384EA96D